MSGRDSRTDPTAPRQRDLVCRDFAATAPSFDHDQTLAAMTFAHGHPFSRW
jgi:hypothetical protein